MNTLNSSLLRWALCLGLCLFMGASSAFASEPVQRASWDRWIEATPQHEQLKLSWQPGDQQLRSAFGLLRAARADRTTEQQIRDFVADVAPRYGVRVQDLKSLGVTGKGRFKVERFEQRHQGLKVVQRQLSVRARADGAILGFESDLAPISGQAAPAKISAEQAKIVATNHINEKTAKAGNPAQVIMVQGTTPLRMFQVDVALPGMRFFSVYVRADNGKVLWVRNRVTH